MAERRPWSLGSALRGMFARRTIDETTWEDLEDALLTADCGPDITDEIVDYLQAVAAAPMGYVRGAVDPAAATFRVVK